MDKRDELTPEILMEDASFRAWVYQGVGDDRWVAWMRESPDREQVARAARKILLSLRGKLEDVPDEQVQADISSLMTAVDAREEDTTVVVWSSRFRVWSVAAAVLLTLSLGTLLFLGRFNSESASNEHGVVQADAGKWIEVYNPSEGVKLVNLPDGSSVVLKRDSKITYPEEFTGDKREVSLSGEAFFEVQKNAAKPFFVYAGEIVTRVLGTSFTVRAYDHDEMVSVRVKSGKVVVAARESEGERSEQRMGQVNEIILEPNQQAVLTRSDKRFSFVAESKLSGENHVIEAQSFEFRRTPLVEVMEILQKVYHIDIRFNQEALQHCTITASLDDVPLMEKLNFICEAIGASYEVDDSDPARPVIQMNADGCE